MGIGGCILNLIKSYLSGRVQRVVIDGISSEAEPVQAGVPQGSILGPLLFLVYINDLPDCVTCNINLFADDSVLWTPVTNPVLASNALNRDLENVHRWACKWHMLLNPDKTEVLTISSKRQLPTYPDLEIGNRVLKKVSSHKHLGLTLTSNMSWREHIDNICKSAGLRINILRKMAYKLNRLVLERLYISYIRPLLEYASPIFCDQNLCNDMKLENIQYQAALVCSGALFNTNRDRLLSELGWAPLKTRREVSRACIVYKALNNLCPEYLTNIYVPSIPQNNQPYRFRTRPNLINIRCRTERLRRSFVPSSIRSWNSIHESTTGVRSFRRFKKIVSKNYSPKPSPIWFYHGKIFPNKLVTRLRLNASRLNGDLFHSNLSASSQCLSVMLLKTALITCWTVPSIPTKGQYFFGALEILGSIPWCAFLRTGKRHNWSISFSMVTQN